MENTVKGRDLFLEKFNDLKEINKKTAYEVKSLQIENTFKERNKKVSKLNNKLRIINIEPVLDGTLENKDSEYTSPKKQENLSDKAKYNIEKIQNIKDSFNKNKITRRLSL